MAEIKNNIDGTSNFNSDSTQNPPPKPTKPREEEEEEPHVAPESKRQKTFPSTLDKIQELSPSNANFSFTFDTKFAPFSPESTPKFGSFNFAVSESMKGKQGADQEHKESGVVGEIEKN